ncbi:MAG: hypothetical protein AAFR61_29530 [Bacteroidota bacterium]
MKLPDPDRPIRLALFCLLLAGLYFLAYGFHGMGDTDQGFISGLAWRVSQGEVPYLDFLYVRPPLSLYLHALLINILPDDLYLLMERLGFYLIMAFTVHACTRSLQQFFDFREIGLSPDLFALLAFILSVHNFPPMAWHTIDGLAFAALGIRLLSFQNSPIRWGIALTAFLAAAACKQAFYPMLVAGPVALLLLHPGRKSWSVLGIFAVMSLFAVGVWAGLAPEYWQAFWAQTTGATRWTELLEVGVIAYAEPFLVILLPLILVWRAQAFYQWKYLPASIFGLTFFGLLGIHVYRAIRGEVYIPPSLGFSQAFFLLAAGIAIKGFWVNAKAHSMLLLMLVVAWCSGISWGYATPMLFFTPILFGFVYGLYEELDFSVPRYVYGIAGILLLWIFSLLYQYPYRDAPRADTQYRLEELSPKFTGIKSGQPFYDQTQELLQLVEKYGANVTVLPAYPLAHYLTGTDNPIGIGWAHNAEMAFDQGFKRVEGELQQRRPVVLVQRKPGIFDEAQDPSRYGSKITQYVLDEGIKADSTRFFWVYEWP